MQKSENLFKPIRFRGKTETYFISSFNRPRFNEIDHYGVMWNGHYINYFETARLAMCQHFGFDMALLSGLGVFLPVHHYELTLRKSVLPTDEIVIAVRPIALTESSMEFIHLLVVNNEVRAFGTVRHIPISKDGATMLFELPDHVRKVLQPLKDCFPC